MCVPFLIYQALELGHGGLFTVETIFAQLIGWKQRLAPCPVVIALQARGTDWIAGSLRPGQQCYGGSTPWRELGLKASCSHLSGWLNRAGGNPAGEAFRSLGECWEEILGTCYQNSLKDFFFFLHLFPSLKNKNKN